MQWRRRKGVMLAYPFEEKRLAKWSPPYIVQPKLDGERCRALITESGVILLSSEENVIYSVPHINKQLSLLDLPTDTELDGELYLHGTSFEAIHSVVGRTVNLHPEHEQMEYHVFDLIILAPQYKRTFELMKLLPTHGDSVKSIFRVPHRVVESFEEVMDCYDEIVSSGYEGIIVRYHDNLYVRKRSIYMMKFKPKKQDEYLILDYKEEISKDGDPKGSLGALICQGSDGHTFSVGTGFTEAQRANMWKERKRLRGRTCVVKYQHITSGKGVPRFPVFVEVV